MQPNFQEQRFAKYLLTGPLGEGGFAQVYRAKDLETGELVALKIFKGIFFDQASVDVLKSEAEIARNLEHPHIVRVQRFAVEGHKPYIVMDYLPFTWRDKHAPGERLPLDLVVKYTRQLASALQYAHDRRVVHRDLKPANLLLNQQGDVLLADFGIARVLTPNGVDFTRHVAGTFQYMAPEAFEGAIERACDQYSLGVMVYEWLTGRQPFDGSLPELWHKHTYAQPEPPSRFVPGLPSAIEQTVLQALAKKPFQRFQSVQSFAAKLEQAASPLYRPTGLLSVGFDPPQLVLPEVAPPMYTPPDPGGAVPAAPAWGSPQPQAGAFPPAQQGASDDASLAGWAMPQPMASAEFARRPALPLPERQQAASALRAPVESLRFTSFYAKQIGVGAWNTLLVYTHIAAALSQVQADAAKFKQELGEQQRESSGGAIQPMRRGAALTIVPQGQGLTFNPSRITFTWLEDWHQSSFRFQAAPDLAGRPVTAEIVICAGPLILAIVNMSLFCEGRLPVGAPNPPDVEASALAYHQIFTSYSHSDTRVVQACRSAYQALGFDVLIDMDSLRAGQKFDQALMRLIDTSDIFQLFWSRRSAESAYVRTEWEYALARAKGEGFIRPVYWELPLVPPPEPLAQFHFKYIELPQLSEAVDVYQQPPAAPARELICFRCETLNPPGGRLCVTCAYDLSGKRAQNDRFIGPSGRPYYARFSMRSGALNGRHFTLHQDMTTIGRTIDNDVCIPDPTVSRYHAILRFDNGHWLLEDKNSHNGSFVNGARINWAQPLSDGDQLRFGDEMVLFQVV